MEPATRIAEWLGGRIHGSVESGLSEAELSRAEDTFGLTFPPLWRAVLRLAHPVPRFVAPQPWHRPASIYPDWRLRDEARTRLLIDDPVEGLLYDVEDNGFWWNAWGTAPDAIQDRLAVARRELARVPVLIPLFGHLHIAGTDESPVFRIIQADIRISAIALADLADDGAAAVPTKRPVGHVPFWSELHAYSQWRGSDSPFANLGVGGFGGP